MIDTAIVGQELDPITFPIDVSKTMELAKALHDDHPAYASAEAAAEHGFDAVPAPLTVTTLANHWNPQGAVGFALSLGISLERLLHGETSWEYLAPVSAGDTLTANRHVSDVTEREGKRGGQMTLVTIETTYVNQHGEAAIRTRDVLIERGA